MLEKQILSLVDVINGMTKNEGKLVSSSVSGRHSLRSIRISS